MKRISIVAVKKNCIMDATESRTADDPGLIYKFAE